MQIAVDGCSDPIVVITYTGMNVGIAEQIKRD